MSQLARRYARALFEVAQDKGAIDAVASDLAAIDGVLADPTVRGAVARSDLPGRAVNVLLGRLAEGRSPLTQNLLRAMGSRRRHPALLELRAAFDLLARESRGELAGIAETARPLGDEQRRALMDLAGRLSGRTVELQFQDNPELIGGVRLRLGNTLYDGSVASALEELHKKLLSAPLA